MLHNLFLLPVLYSTLQQPPLVPIQPPVQPPPHIQQQHHIRTHPPIQAPPPRYSPKEAEEYVTLPPVSPWVRRQQEWELQRMMQRLTPRQRMQIQKARYAFEQKIKYILTHP